MTHHVSPLLTIVAMVLGSLSMPCLADQKSCGVEAAYGAVHAIGINPECEFVNLLTPDYISQLGGSTAVDVCKAVERLGAQATYLQGLGWASLLYAEHPMILHVSSDGQLEAANHWLLFLGVQDGMAKVVDGGGKPEAWPLDRLLIRWRGLAIAVTPRGEADQAKWSLNFGETALSLGVLVGALAAALLFSTIFSSWASARFPAVLTGVALSLAASVFTVSGVRFPIPTEASTRYAYAAIDGPEFDETRLGEFLSLLDDPGNATLLDCRYYSDHSRFPIPGTLNVPIDAKSHEMVAALADKDRTAPIVIFCTSERCGFSERMAVRLTGLGFTNLKIFRGGYVEWFYHDQTEARQS